MLLRCCSSDRDFKFLFHNWSPLSRKKNIGLEKREKLLWRKKKTAGKTRINLIESLFIWCNRIFHSLCVHAFCLRQLARRSFSIIFLCVEVCCDGWWHEKKIIVGRKAGWEENVFSTFIVVEWDVNGGENVFNLLQEKQQIKSFNKFSFPLNFFFFCCFAFYSHKLV